MRKILRVLKAALLVVPQSLRLLRLRHSRPKAAAKDRGEDFSVIREVFDRIRRNEPPSPRRHEYGTTGLPPRPFLPARRIPTRDVNSPAEEIKRAASWWASQLRGKLPDEQVTQFERALAWRLSQCVRNFGLAGCTLSVDTVPCATLTAASVDAGIAGIEECCCNSPLPRRTHMSLEPGRVMVRYPDLRWGTVWDRTLGP